MFCLPFKELDVGLLVLGADVCGCTRLLGFFLASLLDSIQQELVHFLVEKDLVFECFEQGHSIECLHDQLGGLSVLICKEINLLHDVGVLGEVKPDEHFVL